MALAVFSWRGVFVRGGEGSREPELPRLAVARAGRGTAAPVPGLGWCHGR